MSSVLYLIDNPERLHIVYTGCQNYLSRFNLRSLKHSEVLFVGEFIDTVTAVQNAINESYFYEQHKK